MDTNDSQAMAVGLGAGLGGFIGAIALGCVLWHCFCGSWCEKKKSVPNIQPKGHSIG